MKGVPIADATALDLDKALKLNQKDDFEISQIDIAVEVHAQLNPMLYTVHISYWLDYTSVASKIIDSKR